MLLPYEPVRELSFRAEGEKSCTCNLLMLQISHFAALRSK
jgi:hypothetical protein